MRINSSILSIPPYISTAWKNIAAIHVEDQENTVVLVITLLNGAMIEIPELEESIIDTIFKAHAQYLELEHKSSKTGSSKASLSPRLGASEQQTLALGMPLKSGLESDQFTTILQHMPEQSDTPDLPSGLISKIATLTTKMGINDPDSLPQPEPHCNCPHCQIARAMHNGIGSEQNEEIVSDEDLKFRTWDVNQTGDKLFAVSNPIDGKEHYNVYLGEPIGCTCGQKLCEHIQAVLNS